MPDSSRAATDRPAHRAGPVERTRRTGALVRTLGVRELRLRYRQSILNVAWALISPLATLGVYGIILTRGFAVTVSCGPYLSSAWMGLVFWTFFATALSGATSSLISSSNLITKVYLPLESLPLASVAASLVDLAVGLVTLVAVLVVQDVAFGASALWIVLPLVILVTWTAAISMVAGILAAFARDVVHAVGLILRVGFFATPVMYDERLLPGVFSGTSKFNPVGVAITGARDAVLCGRSPDLRLGLTHLGVALGVCVLAVAYIRSVEQRVPDVI